MASTDLGVIFIEGYIPNIMEAILDLPLPPIQLQQPLGTGLLEGQTGKAVDDFFGFLLALEMGDLAPDAKDLSYVGELDVVIQLGTRPDLANLQAPMALIDRLVLRGENRPDAGRRCPGGEFFGSP